MTMQSTIGPLRPPTEAHSLLVRVTYNCPWNRCEFCSVFKGEKFERRRVEDVKKDILAARRLMEYVQDWAEKTGQNTGLVARFNNIPWLHDNGVKSAFLQDSNTPLIKTEELVEILEFLRETFPTLERICSYARAKTLCRKKPAELKRLREAGLSRLHIGLETGDDELLAYIKKGATAGEMIDAGRKSIDAGFEVSEYVIPGLGGMEKWEQHALNSARVLNKIDPHFIRLRTFHLNAGTPIFEKARQGEFHIQSIKGVILEVRKFLEELEVNSEFITSDHSINFYLGDAEGKFPDGKLPRDKERLLKLIDNAFSAWDSRGEPKHNPFMGSLNRVYLQQECNVPAE